MSTLHLYFDETDPSVQFTSTGWADNSSTLWSNGRSKAVTQSSGAGITFKFNGTMATFYGASLNGTSFTPVIDNVPQASQTLPASNPPSYGNWYQTPELQPGEHTVVFKDLPALTLDYIITEVDSSTTFQNTPVLISDTDTTTIRYQGAWTKNFDPLRSLQPFTFLGQYSTHSSCNTGDTISLDFSGSSISLWGVFDWTAFGSVTAAFSIDGKQAAQQHYEATPDSQNRIFGVQTNFLLVTLGNLENSLHTLTVNIVDCQNQRFSLDYITYTPSFTSPADMPKGSSTSSGSAQKSSSFPVGAIAGVAVAAVLLIVAVGALLWFLRRRRRARKADAEPFVSPTSTSTTMKKEEVPAHMRQLRSPASQETFPSGTVDLTTGETSTTNGGWVVAPNSAEFRNINELVAAVAPPAYQNGQSGAESTTDGQTETTTNRNRSRS